MKKVVTLVLSFVAVSLVLAVITLKFVATSSHVQVVEDKAISVSESPASAEHEEQAPVFNLVDENGQPFTAASLKGKISIVNFVFRSCKTVCPFVMSKTRSLASDLSDYVDSIRVVSITVDPTNDTQSKLQAWKEEVAVKGLEWKFVTGSKEEVFATVRDDFKQTVMENAANVDMPIAHSSYLVLVDQNGKIAGFYDSNDNFKIKELTETAKNLATSMKSNTFNH